MAKFTLMIELDKDAMQTHNDVLLAIRNISELKYLSDIPEVGEDGTARHINGSIVGKWEVID